MHSQGVAQWLARFVRDEAGLFESTHPNHFFLRDRISYDTLSGQALIGM
jgi:hypothetical protein